MANYVVSPNMNLPVPTVGLETGPQYATDVNNALTLIDSHTHLPGSGVQITPGAININSDLTFNTTNSATNLLSTRYTSQGSALSNTLTDAVYVLAGNLYYNNSTGFAVQITNGNSVAGSTGTITGLPSGTASASYSGGAFTWQQSTNLGAIMDAQSYILRNNTAGSYGLTLQAPSLSADSTITLPQVPASLKLVTMDSSGNQYASVGFAAGNIGSDGNNLIINPTSITNAQIASGTILGSNISSQTITASNIANSTITASQIATATITGGSSGNIAGSTIQGLNIAGQTVSGGAAGNIGLATVTGDNTSTNYGQASFSISSSGGTAAIATTTITVNPTNNKIIYVAGMITSHEYSPPSNTYAYAYVFYWITVNGTTFAATPNVIYPYAGGTSGIGYNTHGASLSGCFLGLANTTYTVTLSIQTTPGGSFTTAGNLVAVELK